MADDLVIGGQLGNYLIESVIGRGGMSVVYRAKHARLGTSVALKVLAPELSADDTFRERFLREAQMAAGIDHPNVVPIHDLGLQDNSLFIVMRYVVGGDLKALLASTGPMDAGRALELLRPAARALDAAHAHGLVHRDVKPANILIQQSAAGDVEHVYLTDFGVAKSSSISGLTRAGGLIGTVGYMSPEQIEGQPVSPQTDVYALAGVFYECVTGRIPYERELAEGVLPHAGSVGPITRLRPELPAALDGVIAKALARDPADRYASCEQFIDAVGHALESHTASAGATAGATVADQAPRAGETVAADVGPWPQEEPQRGAAVAAGGDPWTPEAPAPPPGPRDGGAQRRMRGRMPIYVGGVVVVAAAAVAIVLASSSSTTKAGRLSSSVLAQVPTNHVTGSGNASVRLSGDVATVTLNTRGLDNNDSLVHPFHIHAGGKGQCPPASAARAHNGHLTISTTDGINYYGPPAQALTTHGDTSPSSILAFPRYLTGGTLHYTRTITLPASLAEQIRQNNAVIVVHGIDYDHSGIYSGVLDRSELNKGYPGTATAPALCGSLVKSPSTTALRDTRGVPARLYTASLLESASVPVSELFACGLGGAATPAPGRRQRT